MDRNVCVGCVQRNVAYSIVEESFTTVFYNRPTLFAWHLALNGDQELSRASAHRQTAHCKLQSKKANNKCMSKDIRPRICIIIELVNTFRLNKSKIFYIITALKVIGNTNLQAFTAFFYMHI